MVHCMGHSCLEIRKDPYSRNSIAPVLQRQLETFQVEFASQEGSRNESASIAGFLFRACQSAHTEKRN
eukprot:g73423.t1